LPRYRSNSAVPAAAVLSEILKRAPVRSARTSCSFTSNFAKTRSHFALSRHEPHVQR
jgi:hypothetical protein